MQLRRRMNTPLLPVLKPAVLALGFAAFSAQAAVLPLDFSGGAGTTGVDQYAGIAGSGWSSPWSATFHSGTASGSATVGSASPLVVGGGNYLQVNFDTTTGGLGRVARQWDTSQISLTSPFTLEFNFRSNVNTSGATQTITLFGSSASASGTGGNDSWKLTADGGGWSAYNNTTVTPLRNGAAATGQILANQTWHFTVTIDPVANTYDVSAQNLTTSSAVFSVAGMALRNGADSSLAWLNFHASGAASSTGRGFAIDSLSITSSAIPEPSSAALLLGGLALGGTMLGRRRRSAS